MRCDLNIVGQRETGGREELLPTIEGVGEGWAEADDGAKRDRAQS